MKPIRYFTVALSLYFCAFLSFAETEEVWIDVRSAFEHKLYRVDGDVRIDHGAIDSQITSYVSDVNTPIRLYCWMGFNAEKAKAVLEDMGYTDVKAGGILEARQARDWRSDA